jgi:acetyltransferase-like isoleucine patch superfamily enzyme
MHVMRVTPRLLALLRERQVLLNSSGSNERWKVGDPFGFDLDCRIEPYVALFEGDILPRAMGAFSYSHSKLSTRVRLGRYCSVASGVAWMGQDHPLNWVGTSPAFYDTEHSVFRAFRRQNRVQTPVGDFTFPDGTVNIGNDVWIGDQAMIAPGVTIGDGAVIGARALVRKDVPPYAVVAGHPARIVRFRFSEDLIARLREAQWWRFTPAVVGPLPAAQPERFLDALAEKVEREALQPMTPLCLAAKDLVAAGEDPQSVASADAP